MDAALVTDHGRVILEQNINQSNHGAITSAGRSIDTNRSFPPAHFAFAAALGLLGVLDDARTAAKAGLALNPSFTIPRLLANPLSDNPTYLAWRERFLERWGARGVILRWGHSRQF